MAVIETEDLTKRYGDKIAVKDLTFTVRPGIVTGFLGPNGAGKSTTMRMIAGLDAPTTGSVSVNGGRYRYAAAPMEELGVLLEARAVHSARSAFHHLLALAFPELALLVKDVSIGWVLELVHRYPTAAELAEFTKHLSAARDLNPKIIDLLRSVPANATTSAKRYLCMSDSFCKNEKTA